MFKKGDVVWLKDRSEPLVCQDAWRSIVYPGEWCTITEVSADVIRFTLIKGYFDSSKFELVNKPEDNMDDTQLIPGEKYTHPNYTSGKKDHKFFYFVGYYPVHKGEVAGAIQYPEGSRFDLLWKELADVKPYKEPKSVTKYLVMFADSSVGISDTFEPKYGGRLACKKIVINEGEWDK